MPFKASHNFFGNDIRSDTGPYDPTSFSAPYYAVSGSASSYPPSRVVLSGISRSEPAHHTYESRKLSKRHWSVPPPPPPTVVTLQEIAEDTNSLSRYPAFGYSTSDVLHAHPHRRLPEHVHKSNEGRPDGHQLSDFGVMKNPSHNPHDEEPESSDDTDRTLTPDHISIEGPTPMYSPPASVYQNSGSHHHQSNLSRSRPSSGYYGDPISRMEHDLDVANGLLQRARSEAHHHGRSDDHGHSHSNHDHAHSNYDRGHSDYDRAHSNYDRGHSDYDHSNSHDDHPHSNHDHSDSHHDHSDSHHGHSNHDLYDSSAEHPHSSEFHQLKDHGRLNNPLTERHPTPPEVYQWDPIFNSHISHLRRHSWAPPALVSPHSHSNFHRLSGSQHRSSSEVRHPHFALNLDYPISEAKSTASTFPKTPHPRAFQTKEGAVVHHRPVYPEI